MGQVQAVTRSAYYAVLALPVAFAPTGVRARVTRRNLRVPFALNSPGWFRTVAHSALAAAIGLVAWFAVFLALVAAVRGIAYPLVAAGDYEHSWGGPTLAGAWAVHFLLGVGLLPLWVLLLAGIGVLQRQLARRLLARTGPWWPIPLAALAFVAAIAFFIAWLHQI
ncbi:hypothetical protein [Nocardia inohanensis]|uniref:hypothetical protein n=1 Tax=Nocardia inohanensis TaxID=209246 RepID=UPI00082DD4FB|nr:hypothetical protein [Nocardia inohanensis]